MHYGVASVSTSIVELADVRIIKSETFTPLCSHNSSKSDIWRTLHASKQRSTARLQLSIIPLLITFNEPIACCSYQYVRLNHHHKSLCSRILWRGRIMRHYLYVAFGDSFGEHKFIEDQTSILFLSYKNTPLLSSTIIQWNRKRTYCSQKSQQFYK